MVSRKPLPDNTSVNTNTPPPAVSIQSVRQELWSATDSESDSERVWGRENPAVPAIPAVPETSAPAVPVQYGGSGTVIAGSDNTLQDVPDALRPGTVSKSPSFHQDQNEENPWDDRNRNNHIETGTVTDTTNPANPANLTDLTDPELKPDDMPKSLWPGGTRFETNPFKRKPVQSPSTSQGSQDSQGPPAASTTPTAPAAPTNPPPPVPVPVDLFSQIQISEPEASTNPWQPALGEPRTSGSPHPAPPLPEQEARSNVWDSGLPPSVPSTGPASNSPSLIPLHTEGEHQPWGGPPAGPSIQQPPEIPNGANGIFDDQHAWDGISANAKGKQPAVPTAQAHSETVDGWNLIDHEPMPEPTPGTLSKQSTWENFIDADDEAPKEVTEPKAAEVPPTLPPRRPSNENPPPPPPQQPQPPQQPPRPQPPSGTGKSETYQIKNINWFDPKAAKNPRRSPILVQNVNGPCPLVALVNALTLTTIANQPDTNLVETLKSREQISLNFLLEAVVDELMTHRYTSVNATLPDMSELYSFLKGLHTGMNVNPRFIPSHENVAAQDTAPGAFENTRDMKLYATFLIPLIHGWLPPREDPAYDAFARQAATYDDVQNILFREEELEDKLSNSDMGLTEPEQQLYQDIIIIKTFLASSATQLTPWGLEVITKTMLPGNVSILFRNDHFSTLYRHPQSLKLFSLVTDAGYYTHDEVVWESLVDVRGERTEFFSGDFRLVGGPQNSRSSGSNSGPWSSESRSSGSAREGEWQTVQNRRSRNNNRNSATDSSSPLAPKHEQEDRDLALALQLQEEEEERHRQEQAARRRESQLSEQFIEQQGRQGTPSRGGRGGGSSVGRGGGGPQPPARSSSANQSTSTLASRGRPAQQVRSLIPPASTTHRPADDTADDAPPSYEQASKATPYVPPAGHPSHPDSSPSSATPRRRPTLPGQGSSAGPSTPGRGRQGAGAPIAAGSASAQAGGGKDKDCIVM